MIVATILQTLSWTSGLRVVSLLLLCPGFLEEHPDWSVVCLFVKASNLTPQSREDGSWQPEAYIYITQNPQRREAFLIPVPLTSVSRDPDWPDEPCSGGKGVVVEQRATSWRCITSIRSERWEERFSEERTLGRQEVCCGTQYFDGNLLF